MATLEVGVASAVAAGVANWLRLRREPGLAEALAAPGGTAPGGTAPAHDGSGTGTDDDGGDGHRIFVDPWADDGEAWHDTERRAKAAAKQRRARQSGRTRLNMLAQRRADSRALVWVRQHHPTEWQRIRAEVIAELEREYPDLAVDRRTVA